MDNQQVITEEDKHWFGAIVDGEGCLTGGVRTRSDHKGQLNVRPAFQLANTDKAIIDECIRILSGCYIPHYVSYKEKPKHGKHTSNSSPYWTISVQGIKRIVLFLQIFAPYFRSNKAQKAAIILEYCQSRLSHNWHAAPFTVREIELISLLYNLNRRGSSENLRDYTRDPHKLGVR